METRPTTDKVKESLFSIIQFDIEGRRVLEDVYKRQGLGPAAGNCQMLPGESSLPAYAGRLYGPHR